MATKKNPAPAQPPTKPAAKAAPAPDPVDDLEEDLEETEGEDDHDDDDGEPNGAKSRNWLKTQRLPAPKREAVLIANIVNKTTRRAGVIEDWPGDELVGIRKHLAQAIDGMKAAADALAKLPDSYKARVPHARKSGGAELAPGTLVRITEKQAETYKGVIEDEQFTGITLLEVRGNKVVLRLPGDGEKIIIPRGHVTLDADA
jgi:hypothetical protein